MMIQIFVKCIYFNGHEISLRIIKEYLIVIYYVLFKIFLNLYKVPCINNKYHKLRFILTKI